LKDGRVLTGPSHAHIYDRLRDESGSYEAFIAHSPWVDGFVTDRGEFVDREQAHEIATSAGQVRADYGKGDAMDGFEPNRELSAEDVVESAACVVSTLLEDELDPDLEATLGELDWDAPKKRLKAGIEDDLYDRGWMSVEVHGEAKDETFTVIGTFFDQEHRAMWNEAGARAIPAPELTKESVRKFALFATNTLRGALRRAGFKFSNMRVEEVNTIYNTLDLESVEATLGDVSVEVSFNWIDWTTTFGNEPS
jgi:hypothetical protein